MYRGDDERVLVSIPLALAREFESHGTSSEATVKAVQNIVRARLKRRDEERTPVQRPAWVHRK